MLLQLGFARTQLGRLQTLAGLMKLTGEGSDPPPVRKSLAMGVKIIYSISMAKWQNILSVVYDIVRKLRERKLSTHAFFQFLTLFYSFSINNIHICLLCFIFL